MKTPPFPQARELRQSIRAKYRKVRESPSGLFSYPVGREGAIGLNYNPTWFNLVSRDVVDRFVGVGNPFKIRKPISGDRVLDAGCGCGFDTFIAASMAGPSGMAVGIDLTEEMLSVPRAAAGSFQKGNVEFLAGSLEQIPFNGGSFDLVISNGVLNLVPDKQSAFMELARVIRRGGALICADLLVIESIPQEILASVDAWST